MHSILENTKIVQSVCTEVLFVLDSKKIHVEKYFPLKSVYFLQQQLSDTGRPMRQIVGYETFTHSDDIKHSLIVMQSYIHSDIVMQSNIHWYVMMHSNIHWYVMMHSNIHAQWYNQTFTDNDAFKHLLIVMQSNIHSDIVMHSNADLLFWHTV